jgi:hypothetical protein
MLLCISKTTYTFFKAIGHATETEDKSDKLLSMEEQLKWLKEIGFEI